MKLREIFRFEFMYQIRQVWTWLFFAALLVFSFLMTRDGSLAEALHDDFFVNSPFAIAKTTIAGNLIWLLITAVIAGEAASRDVATRMHPLVYTAPISRLQYLGGRFVATLALNALMLLVVQIGIILGVYLPGMDPEVIGPFRPAAFLTAFAFLSLPNAFIATALQFTIASGAGRPMAAYLGSMILFFMSYILGLILLFNGRQDLANILDPVGVHFILSELSHLWTTTEKNYRLLTLDGIVLTNRMLWSGVAIVFMFIGYFRFQFRHRVLADLGDQLLKMMRIRKGPIHDAELAIIPTDAATRIAAEAEPAFSLSSELRKTGAIAWSSFASSATSWAGIAMLVVIPLMCIPVIIDQMESNGVPLLPTTVQVLTEITTALSSETSRWVIIPLLMIFFAGEVVWKEREAGLGEITDAMPGSEWSVLLGKFFGLTFILIAYLSLTICAGIAAQAILGYDYFEIGLYLATMFGLQLPEYLLFTLLALAIHVVVNQKYIGHLLAVIAYVMIALAPMFGLEHNLLIFGAGPAWSYTDMRGFGNSVMPWLWFKLYWTAWCLLIAIAAYLLWVRGKETNFSVRLRAGRNRLKGVTRVMCVIAVTLVLSLGAFIFYNTNILNDYQTDGDIKAMRARYEILYGKYAALDQPRLYGTKLKIDIHPSIAQARIKGVYTLLNKGREPIDTIAISTAHGVQTKVSFSQMSTALVSDDELGFYIYKLEQPLYVNDSIHLMFDVSVEQRGFRENGLDNSIVENGSQFNAANWCPSIGYQRSGELMEVADRREYDLPPRPIIPSLYDSQAIGKYSGGIRFEAIVSTEQEETAVAPGLLHKQWSDNGRSYFHYIADAPIGGEWSIFSAQYATRNSHWYDSAQNRSVAIQIFHHPPHTANLERMTTSINASLAYYTKEFGPYKHGHLTLVEHPGNGTGMHADASMISFSEGFSLWVPSKEGSRSLDLPYAITSHEMAHQWTLPYASVEGAPVMSESLAWYYGLKAVQHSRGESELHRLLGFMRQPYPYPPIRRGEPLLRGLDPYLSYRRGPFALYTLSEYAGDEKVNEALKNLLAKHRIENTPLATTLDLYNELKTVTPDTLQSLLHDLFQVNTYWELRTKRMSVSKTGSRRWRVMLDIEAEKVVDDSTGVETTIPMRDFVEIGIYGEDGNVLYLKKHLVNSGEQQLTIHVNEKPLRAGIDPRHLLIDINPDDNIVDAASLQQE